MSTYAEASAAVSGEDDARHGMCAAPGCCLSGALTASTAGSKTWWCTVHFQLPHAEHDAATALIANRRELWKIARQLIDPARKDVDPAARGYRIGPGWPEKPMGAAPMKPRIRLESGTYVCQDDFITRRGKSARQAYDRWLNASLRDAFTKSTPAKPLRPARKSPPHRGKAIDIAAMTKAAPIKPPMYSESVVHQVPGVVSRPAYVPPLELRMRVARAAGVQPPLVSVSGAGPAGRSLGGREADE